MKYQYFFFSILKKEYVNVVHRISLITLLYE